MHSKSNLRKTIFLGVDFVKGNLVKKHLQSLESYFFKLKLQERKATQSSLLKSLISYSVKNTLFYSKYNLADDINSFPIVDKNTIRGKESDFISSEFKPNELIKAVTSGSTGTPFVTYQHKDKKSRNTADTIFFASLGGYNLGEKLFYFKIWSDNNKKDKRTLFFQNIMPVDVIELQKNEDKVYESLLKESKKVNFLGYVSAFETLIKGIQQKGNVVPKNRVGSIITMSESINDYVKENGKEVFGCPVLARYSNIENGIIAQQTLLDENVYLINTASYFVEIFDIESNHLVPDGTLGRIVVTDLFNRAMPMIRYDTGDLGIKSVKAINGIESEVLVKIEGRKLDQIFNTKGELLSSYIVYKNMWQYTEIHQYQFIQWDAKSYEFKISMDETFQYEEKLIQEFKNYLGEDAIFKVTYVKEIPLLNSGKRKKIVSHYKK